MALPMSDAMIASEYRQAKKKQSQIHILADLNGTDTKTIVEILTREGCELPGNFKKKAAPAPEAAPEVTADPIPQDVYGMRPWLDQLEAEENKRIRTKAKLAALDAIEIMLPEITDDQYSVDFVLQVRGVFAMLHQMEAQNGR